ARGAPGDDRRGPARSPARGDQPSAPGGRVAPGRLSRPGTAAGSDARRRRARHDPGRRERPGALDRDLPHEPRRAARCAALAGRAARRAGARARVGRRRGARGLAGARRGVAPGAAGVKVRGTVRPPGDKSISHRALMLAALAHGRSELAGLLTGEDVKSTARVLRQLGVVVSPIRDGGTVTVHASRITHPTSRLHCGNSGTTARLLLGILAGQRFPATLTGDASLRRAVVPEL